MPAKQVPSRELVVPPEKMIRWGLDVPPSKSSRVFSGANELDDRHTRVKSAWNNGRPPKDIGTDRRKQRRQTESRHHA